MDVPRGQKNRRSTPWSNRHCLMCLTRPKSRDAALRLGRGLPVGAGPSRAENAVGCMGVLARARRGVAGTAITKMEAGLPRPSRSEDGYGRWSGTLRKRAPANESEVWRAHQLD